LGHEFTRAQLSFPPPFPAGSLEAERSPTSVPCSLKAQLLPPLSPSVAPRAPLGAALQAPASAAAPSVALRVHLRATLRTPAPSPSGPLMVQHSLALPPPRRDRPPIPVDRHTPCLSGCPPGGINAPDRVR
jgi:hypothetical protein